MFKFIKKYSFILIILLGSFTVNAGIINQLTSDDYITVDHGNNDLLDWAWASSSSVEYSYITETINGQEVTVLDNQFFAPETVAGWRVATTDEFNYFLDNIFLSDFTNSDGSYITAHSFWNTNDEAFDSSDFASRDVASAWVENSTLNYNLSLIPDDFWFDTFFVRTHSVDPQPVPEPSTLMIFALGLIALASKKKIFKSVK